MGPEAGSEAEVLERHASAPLPTRVAVSVLTPTGSVLTREVAEVIAPGADGEFGILPGHVPFVSALKAGVLVIRDEAQRQVFAVGPGFLEVTTGGRTQVLVQRAVAAADVDTADAQLQKGAAEDVLRRAATGGTGEPGTASDPGAVAEARANLAWAQAQLDAAAQAH
jgi:F-type H+-transporting ATPase subunit epsilon